jgi:PilZ domain
MGLFESGNQLVRLTRFESLADHSLYLCYKCGGSPSEHSETRDVVSEEHRQDERLNADYVVAIRLIGFDPFDNAATITNLSQGGLCFVSILDLRQGDKVEIKLPPDRPVVMLKAKVVWCRPQRDKFSAGVEYIEMSDVRRTPMFEMHKAIVAYQKMNDLSGNARQATAEWLNLYAEKFLAGTR